MIKRNIILLLAFIVIMTGCAGNEQFGEKISGQEITEVGDILSAPAGYENETVRIQGKIVQECPSGCWLNLKDKTGIIYVDIAPYGLAIPQRVGQKATVEGKVVIKERGPIIIGKGMEIK